MRPGLLPRRYYLTRAAITAALMDFNEAGAFAPEILGWDLWDEWSRKSVFNEAGAFAPEILANVWSAILMSALLQ